MKLSVPIYHLKRQAKLHARQSGVPLNEALNAIAKHKGYTSWSGLAAAFADRNPAAKILDALGASDLVLLGARPGHGKTMLGIELVVEAIKAGRQAAFFSLEFTQKEMLEKFANLGVIATDDRLILDTSDDICADYIIKQLAHAPRGCLVVIDYLQLLDQNRANPVLATQVTALKSFAKAAGTSVVMISQIDRSYDPTTKPMPDIDDVRLPNSLDLTLFTKAVFLNGGSVKLQDTR
ncbi:DNA helicase [Pseudosulfitobacter sp. SM2401]|uniref:DNA helicase n=1 Tax=Pseudosulfitobacter sp. SM2401 TaxID=3350098 RepID=UPI0036F1F217